MQIYIATDDGGKQGPLFLHQIETMIREGTVQPSQLGWHRDLSDWIPLREIPAVRELLESREREEIKAKLDKESADGTVITRAQVEDAARGRSVLPTNRRPLARFAARLFDSLLVLSVARHFFVMPAPPPDLSRDQFYAWMAQPEILQKFLYLKLILSGLVLILESLFIHFWGATPGKALFRIRLSLSGERPLGLGKSFLRAATVWLAGCGTWDICLGAIALPFGLISLLQTGRTWWDARFAVVVHHSPLRPAHILLILLAFYAILLSFAR